MAKKRLNKKVAIISSAVFILFALIVTASILYLSRDPEKCAKDGDAAFAAKDYEKATHSYLKARALSKDDSFKVQMLYKLVTLYIETDKWRNVLGCWNEIARLDPKDLKSRYCRLRYFYTIADSGAGTLWQDIDEQINQFIETVQEQNLLTSDVNSLETFGLSKSEIGTSQLGPYLYTVKGRAELEKARKGLVTDQEETLSQSISDLTKAMELDDKNIDTYWYLAQAFIARGDVFASRGNIEAKAQALIEAKEILEKCIEKTDDMQAHINIIAMRPAILQMTERSQMKTLEPEYLKLAEKFKNEPKIYSVMAAFYSNLGYKYLDKAITEAEKAINLDNERVEYDLPVCDLYYKKYSIFKDENFLHNAVDLAQKALLLPGAQETKGPQQWINRRNRIWLNSFLAYCYFEQIVFPSKALADNQKQEYLSQVEKCVHEIEQLYGSGEEPTVVKWKGMLELAKGDRVSAIRKLAGTYEQLKASGRRDMQLSYILAKLFENTDELGAAADFFGNALNINDRNVPEKIDDSKPESLLDYADLLLKLHAYGAAISLVDYFESEYWQNQRSKIIRIQADIGQKNLEQAQENLAKENPQDPNIMQLNLSLLTAKQSQIQTTIARNQMQQNSDIWKQMIRNETESANQSQAVDVNSNSTELAEELTNYFNSSTELVNKLMDTEPNFVKDTYILGIFNSYISKKKFSEAGLLIDKYLKHFPQNTNVQVCKKILSEPEPAAVTAERRAEIEKEVISNIADPIARATYLGVYYQQKNEPNFAIEEFKKVIETTPTDNNESNFEKLNELQRMAAASLADISLKTKDVNLIHQVSEISKKSNLDDCDGKFFSAIAAMVKEDYNSALSSIDDCIKQRPVFSYGYMIRSNINDALGNEHAAIDDIQKAASINPLDGLIAKVLTNQLYQRNQKLGSNITMEQQLEAKTTLDKAMALNPGDMQLLGFYSESISEKEPIRAIAIRQMLQKNAPNMENSYLLGRMAMRVAGQQTDEPKRKMFLDVAESSLKQALSYDHSNKAVIESLGEYYRMIGQADKAEELLSQSQEPKLLWRHYLKAGQLEKAKEILVKLYEKTPKDTDTLRGLVAVSENYRDKNGILKYSDELLNIEDNKTNRLMQVQILLQSGLVQEAENKLKSFKEKYPDDKEGLQVEGWVALKEGKLQQALDLINKNLELNQDDVSGWRLRGEINNLLGNFDDAVADLKKSKGLSDVPATRIALAKALLKIGRGEDAITELEVLLDDPKAPVEGALLLEELYKKVNKKKLVNLYKKMLENFPDNLLWYDRAGKYSVSINDFDTAASLYEKGWHRSNEKSRDMLEGYLESLIAAGKIDKAVEDAGKYVDTSFAPLALYILAEAKFKLNNKAEAAEYCRQAIEKAVSSENASSWVLEKIHKLLGPNEVLSICKEKLEKNPESPSANYAMYDLMRLNGEYNKALDYLGKCTKFVQADSETETELKMKKIEVLQLAYLKTSDNSYLDNVISEYKSLIEKMPNNTNILNNMAYVLTEANQQLDEALDYAKRAYEIMPNDAGLMDTYGYVMYKLNKNKEDKGQTKNVKENYLKAAELLQAAIQQYELSKTSVPSEVYEHLGMIKEAVGANSEAVTAYQQSLDAGGDNISAVTKERIKTAIKMLSN